MSSVIYDIETGPQPEEIVRSYAPEFDREEVKCGNRGAEKAEVYRDEKEKEHWEKVMEDAALDARTAVLLCIGYRYPNGRTDIKAGEEAEILGDFWDRYYSTKKAGGNLISFNGNKFDQPFCLRRTFILNAQVKEGERLIRYPRLSTLLWKNRYWDDVFMDLRDLWTLGQGWGDSQAKTGGLNGLSRAFGGPGKGDEGKRFHEIWKEDRPKAIEYVTNDLDQTELVARGMGVWP